MKASPRVLSDWLLERWNDCVPLDRTKLWTERLSLDVSITVQQLGKTLATIERLSDDEFSTWLLDEAEPWEQSLMLNQVVQTVRLLDHAKGNEPIVLVIAVNARKGFSLRKQLAEMLRTYHQAASQ